MSTHDAIEYHELLVERALQRWFDTPHGVFKQLQFNRAIEEGVPGICEKYFKVQLNILKDSGQYDTHDRTDRMLLAFLLIPLLQKHLDSFKDTIWNTHRIRKQVDTFLPDGIPNHVYDFPEKYGLEDCGWHVNEDQLREVAEYSNALHSTSDYLDPDFRERCERLIPLPGDVEPNECVNAYLYLKENMLNE